MNQISESKSLQLADHLVYAVQDLEKGIDDLERLLGVRAILGGQHLAWGTHNALIALGERSYLEIIAPDPEQPIPDHPRPFRIDELQKPHLVTWAAKSSQLESICIQALNLGIDLGNVLTGSRRQTDGALLSWRLTDPYADRLGSVVPFFIDWGDSTHPASNLPKACRLIDLRIGSPIPDNVKQVFEGLGIDLPVEKSEAPSLVATISVNEQLIQIT